MILQWEQFCFISRDMMHFSSRRVLHSDNCCLPKLLSHWVSWGGESKTGLIKPRFNTCNNTSVSWSTWCSSSSRTFMMMMIYAISKQFFIIIIINVTIKRSTSSSLFALPGVHSVHPRPNCSHCPECRGSREPLWSMVVIFWSDNNVRIWSFQRFTEQFWLSKVSECVVWSAFSSPLFVLLSPPPPPSPSTTSFPKCPPTPKVSPRPPKCFSSAAGSTLMPRPPSSAIPRKQSDEREMGDRETMGFSSSPPPLSHSRSREVREGGREAIEETEGGPNLA